MSYTIHFPHAGIVLFAGPSNSGKTTLLEKLVENGVLKKSEVISSDQFRELIGDTDFLDWNRPDKDEADAIFEEYQKISKAAFSAMEMVIEKRCQLNKLTVIDATHLYPEDRKVYIDIAKKHHLAASIIALDIPEEELLRRDKLRENPRGKKRIKQQSENFKKYIRSIKKEGIRSQYILKMDDLDNVRFTRSNNPLYLSADAGLDIIGDVHGCYTELIELLKKLGYQQQEDGLYRHPHGRKIVSLGDVLSRGPSSLDTLQFFLKHIKAGLAYMIDSNHGWKIARWLDGRNVTLNHGDEKVAEEFLKYEAVHGKEKTEKLKAEIKEMLMSVPSHYILTKHGVGVAAVVHAGIKDEYIGKQSHIISDFCRYGDTDGPGEEGKPIRKDWTVHHETKMLIIWGHEPKIEPLFSNNTLNIDQGAVFGGKLTAYRYPENKIVSVKSIDNYAGTDNNPLLLWEKQRFAPPNASRFINGYTVFSNTIGEIRLTKEHVLSALDISSRFTIPIEEMVYLPPTMSPPPKPSSRMDYMEHPNEAFNYYIENGIKEMIVEKKHMGSRAILLLFKNEEAGKAYINRESLGTIYTRGGRAFFHKDLERKVVTRLVQDLHQARYFDKYNTDFVLLDAEILPWNLKAKELIHQQYAHTGEMAQLHRMELRSLLNKARQQGKNVDNWAADAEKKIANTAVFQEVFQTYMWETNGIDGIQIAPFHTLAHSEQTFFDKTHLWHMEKNEEFSHICKLFVRTEYRIIKDEKSMIDAVQWWKEITEDGHEGFVVKPMPYLARNEKGKLLQPAIKVRGRKYLHIIYGMDYLQPENLKRLKMRNVGKKQRNALKEFSLGIEAVERFVKKDSIERIHECVLGILALETEPIDPRL